MHPLCTNLRQVRGLFSYSQEYVAQCAHISQANYCKIENGKVKPALAVLTEIANLYHISLGDLLETDTPTLIRQVVTKSNFEYLCVGGVIHRLTILFWLFAI